MLSPTAPVLSKVEGSASSGVVTESQPCTEMKHTQRKAPLDGRRSPDRALSWACRRALSASVRDLGDQRAC